MKGKIIAIVPAAGVGKRFGESRNKPFYELLGKPLLVWVLEALDGVEEIDEIIPVLKGSDLAPGAELIENHRIAKVRRIIPGGKERQDSVYNGLKVLDDGASAVIVHDGARPFIGNGLVKKMLAELDGCDGVIVGVPVKDTIKEAYGPSLMAHGKENPGKEILVKKTLDRSSLWAVQTPQVFHFRKIRDAHQKARSDNFYATDDAALIEKYGGRIKIVQGSYHNIKITTPEDIPVAEAILRASKL